jgi:glycosyltransferase involved in cell wall biosynthesis
VNIALVNLTSGGVSGGYRKYLIELVPRLRAHAGVGNLHVFLPPGLTHALEIPTLTWPSDDARRGFRELRRQIESRDADVVFIPTARWVATSRPTVVMVRNMEPLTRPIAGNTLSEAARNLARRWVARRACVRADRVIAVSRHVRDFVCGRWNLPAGRVGLVYHGVDPAPAVPDRPPPLLSGIEGPWIFTAGSIRPARGLEDLVHALPRLGSGVRLVVAGGTDPSAAGYERRLRELASQAGVDRQIVWAGRLDPDSVAWCYSRCAVYVTTTRTEACPNTALEALSHGCSIVATDVDPMPEFFGPCARYYRAAEGDMLAARVQEALAEPADERARRAKEARALTARFSWDETVQRTVAELGVAVAGGRRRLRRGEARCAS